VLAAVSATDPVTVEVEDVGVGAQIDRRHSATREIEHANERVVFAVIGLLCLVLHDRGRAIGVENDKELTSCVDTDAWALIEWRRLRRRTRRGT
jgi:hypothetical protein